MGRVTLLARLLAEVQVFCMVSEGAKVDIACQYPDPNRTIALASACRLGGRLSAR
jgi:hypothetical protein